MTQNAVKFEEIPNDFEVAWDIPEKSVLLFPKEIYKIILSTIIGFCGVIISLIGIIMQPFEPLIIVLFGSILVAFGIRTIIDTIENGLDWELLITNPEYKHSAEMQYEEYLNAEPIENGADD